MKEHHEGPGTDLKSARGGRHGRVQAGALDVQLLVSKLGQGICILTQLP